MNTIAPTAPLPIPSWSLTGSVLKPESNGKNGWPQVFVRDNFTCVYCGRDLLADPDHLIGSATDHIVPQRAFTAGGIQDPNHDGNLAASCAVCNNLKGDFMPVLGDPAWDHRYTYLEVTRKHIVAQRAAKRRFYTTLISSLGVRQVSFTGES